MRGLDVIGAGGWRLDSPIRQPPEICPICGAEVTSYDVALDAGECARGHVWHRCPIHHRTLRGSVDFDRPKACSCHRNLAIGVNMIGLDLLGAAPPAPPTVTNKIDSSENIYQSNPLFFDRNAPAPTSATSYYPEAPGFVEDPRKLDINRDFGMLDYVPQWDSPEQQATLGAWYKPWTWGDPVSEVRKEPGVDDRASSAPKSQAPRGTAPALDPIKPKLKPDEPEPWWKRHSIVEALPNYGVVAGGAGLVGVAAALAAVIIKRKGRGVKP